MQPERTDALAAAQLPAGFPAGRRTPKGVSRWYLAQCPKGAEAATARRLRRLAPAHVLEDAFVLTKERFARRQGAWAVERRNPYPGYIFVSTSDAAALAKALASLSFPVSLVAHAPLSREAQAFYERVAERVGAAERCVRASRATIEGGLLVASAGPVAGMEERVVRVDRHRRFCLMQVGEPGAHGSFVERLALEVTAKSAAADGADAVPTALTGPAASNAVPAEEAMPAA